MHLKYDLAAKNVPVKRAAKTIVLYSCDVESCEDMSAIEWRKEESRRKDERIARPKREMMLASRIIHINRVFLYTTFQNMSLYGKNDAFRSSTSRRFCSFVGLMLRTGFEDACYEYIPLVKLGEDNQRIQLKRMLIKGPVSTPYTIVQYPFRVTFRKRRIVSFLLLFISRG